MAQSSVDNGLTVSVDINCHDVLQSPLGEKPKEDVGRNSSTDEDDTFGKTSLRRRPIIQDFSDDSDVEIPMRKEKNQAQRFSDRYNDTNNVTIQNGDKSTFSDKEVTLPNNRPLQNDSDSSSDTSTFNNHQRQSRIRTVPNEEDSDSHSLPSSKKTKVTLKNKEQQARMMNKRGRMQDKFKNLINSRGKVDDKLNDLRSDDNSKSDNERMYNHSENSEEEESSIDKLKQVSGFIMNN